MQSEREGGCTCGAVRYRIAGEPLAVAVCHCTECQRQSGSAFSMSMVVPREALTVSKGEPKVFTRPSDSGNDVACYFCAECGTRVYHAPEALPQYYNLKPGTLDDTSWIRPNLVVWLKSRDVATFDENPSEITRR